MSEPAQSPDIQEALRDAATYRRGKGFYSGPYRVIITLADAVLALRAVESTEPAEDVIRRMRDSLYAHARSLEPALNEPAAYYIAGIRAAAAWVGEAS